MSSGRLPPTGRGSAPAANGTPRPSARAGSASTVPTGAAGAGRQGSSTPGPPGVRPGAGATQSMIRPRGVAPPQRMMFRPVMPARRPVQVKAEPGESSSGSPTPSASSTASPGFVGEGRGQGGERGRGGPGRGRGRGRGGAPVELVASGPFSMGSSSHMGVGRRGASGVSRPHLQAPSSFRGDSDGIKSDPSRSIYRNPDAAALKEREEYSDPEEDGIEIVDMDDVATLDELAPRALPRMKDQAGSRKGKVKREGGEGSSKQAIQERGSASDTGKVKTKDEPKIKVKADPDALVVDEVEVGDDEEETPPRAPQPDNGETDKNDEARTADALDLDASEEEEVMDDLVEDFVGGLGMGEDDDPDNRLYLFQFPPLFPKFEVPREEAGDAAAGPSSAPKRRSVAFADDTLGGGGAAGSSPGPSIKREGGLKDDPDADSKLGAGARSRKAMGPEGQIGRLDVFRDGRVNFNFGDLVMELTGGSQSTFLQQVMILDAESKKATTLGELHRKFVVSPEVESMLADVNVVDEGPGSTEHP